MIYGDRGDLRLGLPVLLLGRTLEVDMHLLVLLPGLDDDPRDLYPGLPVLRLDGAPRHGGQG